MDETTKMNPEVKAKWVAALRSGEYTQTTGVLRSATNTYCCLGVLCEIAVAEGVILPPELHPSYGWRYGMSTCNPPRRVSEEWAGIPEGELFDVRGPDERGDYASRGSAIESLMHLNDVNGESFEKIADWIEANL